MTDRLAEYRMLLAKVDAKVEDIVAHQAAQMACAEGCHACCAPGLSVTAVEAAAIAAYLAEHADARAATEALAKSLPWGESRCQFLNREGACSVYPVRPLVCRTQGLPIALENGTLTACSFNFRNGLDDLPAADRVDQSTLSTVLFVIDQRFAGGLRRPLTLAGVTAARSPAGPAGR